ncbi:MAG: hypothetical protein B6242_08620 [Anaerolineaceae bacterium 4572_78]|nr:MAG: hypothetical protein B6242_08620 [Anaerolineaceae bacterium 4572_78]
MIFILAGGENHKGVVELEAPFLPKMYFPRHPKYAYMGAEKAYVVQEHQIEYTLKPFYVPEDYEEAQIEEEYDEVIEYFYVVSELEEEMACFAVEAIGQQQRRLNEL